MTIETSQLVEDEIDLLRKELGTLKEGISYIDRASASLKIGEKLLKDTDKSAGDILISLISVQDNMSDIYSRGEKCTQRLEEWSERFSAGQIEKRLESLQNILDSTRIDSLSAIETTKKELNSGQKQVEEAISLLITDIGKFRIDFENTGTVLSERILKLTGWLERELELNHMTLQKFESKFDLMQEKITRHLEKGRTLHIINICINLLFLLSLFFFLSKNI